MFLGGISAFNPLLNRWKTGGGRSNRSQPTARFYPRNASNRFTFNVSRILRVQIVSSKVSPLTIRRHFSENSRHLSPILVDASNFSAREQILNLLFVLRCGHSFVATFRCNFTQTVLSSRNSMQPYRMIVSW